MSQRHSELVVVDGSFQSERVEGAGMWVRCAVIEQLEGRTLLAAAITVLGPTGVNIVNGQNIDLTPLVGPVSQAAGQTFTTTFTVQNSGDQTLRIGRPTALGDFRVQTAPLSLLGPRQTSSLVLSLDLSTAGTRTGTIILPTSAPDAGLFSFTVNLDVTATGPKIDITNGSTDLVSGVTTVNFGTVAQGQARPTQTFTITNQGTTTLSLGQATVPTGFFVTKNYGQTILPGASDTLTVAMDTSLPGTRSGSIIIPSNDPNTNPFTIPVTGQVVTPAPAVTVQLGGQTIQNGATTVDFGKVGVGQTGPTKTFTVTNSGSAFLVLGQVVVPAGFTVTQPLTTGLAAGASGTFTVQLNSATLGTKSGFITFSTSDPTQNPFNIPVVGVVAAAAPAVAVQTGGQNLVSGVTVVNFGNVGQGQTGPTKTFTVSNNGTTPLTLGSVVVPAGFTLTQGFSNASLDPGASDSFTVQMNSATLGTRSGFISFTTNDPNTNTFTIPVTGAVVQPVPAALVQVGSQVLQNGVTTVDFGSVGLHQPGPTQTFTVTNVGTDTLTLGTPTLPAGFTLTQPLATSLAPGTSGSFVVQLDSSSLGTKSGTIRFATNDPRQSQFDIPVIGTVVPAVAAVQVQLGTQTIVSGVTPVSFGSVAQGQVGPTRTFTVTNAGTSDVTLGNVTVPAGFILTDPLTTTTLTPGASDTFTVQLDSSTVGAKSGSISFPTNVAGENPFTIPVVGLVTSATTGGTTTVGTGGMFRVMFGAKQLRSGGSAVSFQSVVRGGVGQTRTFTVTNMGKGTLVLANVKLPRGFTLVEPLASRLGPGQSDTFTVRMNSALVGRRAGTIRIVASGPRKRSFGIPVTGRVSKVVVAARGPVPHLFSAKGIVDAEAGNGQDGVMA